MSNDNPQQPPAISADFPFAVRHVQVHGARMAYVDEGEGDPIVFLHGNPTSAYLWRNVIPHVTSVGRCIAPDLIGMGQSDKPDIEYRFVDHVRYVEGLIETLALNNLTLVLHGWGGVIGFDYARRHEENVKGMVFVETLLAPYPSWDVFPDQGREAFRTIRTTDMGWEMLVNQNLFIEQFLPAGVV